MTTLAAWISYQNKNPVALNIASDSRFTWGSEQVRWDGGRKTFWCKRGGEIFGYAGDVITQSNILSQVCELVDYSDKLAVQRDAESRHKAFFELFKAAVDAQVGVPKRGMVVFHGTRVDDEAKFPFRLWKTSFDTKTEEWSDDEHHFPQTLDVSETDKTLYPKIALSAGTGATIFRARRDENFKKYGCSSRSVFNALAHAISPAGDKKSGGPAQAVTLGLNEAPAPIGFYMNDQCSLVGMPLGEIGAGGAIDWRDGNFEFVRASDLQKKSGAPNHYFW
jgi:hypothetical protein